MLRIKSYLFWSLICGALIVFALVSCSPLVVDGVAVSEVLPTPTQGQGQPIVVQNVAASLPAMTAEECAKAAEAAGWSHTYSQYSDGCWIIDPEGQTKHLGTWKE